MDKVIKKSFGILVKSSAIMQPLIFYILLILLFGAVMGSKVFINPIGGIIFSVLMFFLLVAFLSGWFRTIKHAVDTYINFNKEEKDYPMKIAVYNIDTLKKFFPGVGEYFLSLIVPVLVYTIFCACIFVLGMKLFHISNSEIYSILTNTKIIPGDLSVNTMLSLSLALLFISGMIQIFQFLIMFWIPAMYYVTPNPLKSLWVAIKFLFKNFFYSIGLYFFILVSMLIMNVLNIICSFNYILSLIFLIAELYYVTYLFVLIFTAYKEKNIQLEIEKINSQDVFIKSCDVKENNDVDRK